MKKPKRQGGPRPLWKSLPAALGLALALELGLAALLAALTGAGLLRPGLMKPLSAGIAFAAALCAAAGGAARAEKLRFPVGLGLGLALAGLDLLLGRCLGGGTAGGLIPAALGLGALLGAFGAAGRRGLHKQIGPGTRYSGRA